jgi:hypothetical protein
MDERMRAALKAQETNYGWFVQNFEELVREFDGMFIAIHKGRVVGSDDNPAGLREKVLNRGLRLSEVTVEYVSKEPLTFIL